MCQTSLASLHELPRRAPRRPLRKALRRALRLTPLYLRWCQDHSRRLDLSSRGRLLTILPGPQLPALTNPRGLRSSSRRQQLAQARSHQPAHPSLSKRQQPAHLSLLKQHQPAPASLSLSKRQRPAHQPAPARRALRLHWPLCKSSRSLGPTERVFSQHLQLSCFPMCWAMPSHSNPLSQATSILLTCCHCGLYRGPICLKHQRYGFETGLLLHTPSVVKLTLSTFHMQFVAWFLRLKGFETLEGISWNNLYAATQPPDADVMANARQQMKRKLHPDKVICDLSAAISAASSLEH